MRRSIALSLTLILLLSPRAQADEPRVMHMCPCVEDGTTPTLECLEWRRRHFRQERLSAGEEVTAAAIGVTVAALANPPPDMTAAQSFHYHATIGAGLAGLVVGTILGTMAASQLCHGLNDRGTRQCLGASVLIGSFTLGFAGGGLAYALSVPREPAPTDEALPSTPVPAVPAASERSDGAPQG